MDGANKVIVVKIGGSTLGSHDTTLEDLIGLQKRGVLTVVVHGGGKIISQWMKRQGTLPRFVRGLRVTDETSLKVVTAVLTGLVNKELVAALIARGGRAMGLSGVDGGLLQAEFQDRELGFVGRVVAVDCTLVQQALKGGYMPVVAPVGLHRVDGSAESGCLLNINADTVAGEVAYALGATRLVFLTDVEGLADSSGRLLTRVSLRQGRDLLTSGTVKEGMLPKLEACLRAAERGARAQIVDGRQPGALVQCLEGATLGTTIE